MNYKLKVIRLVTLTLVAFATISKAQTATVSTKKDAAIQDRPTAHSKIIKTQGTNEFVNVYCALTDRSGNLWFGTSGEGVYRYDGKLFTQYLASGGLTSNMIRCIAEDNGGRMWFGTNKGITCFDGKKFSNLVIPVIHGPSVSSGTPQNTTPESANDVWSIMQDKRGVLWFGTAAGVVCYDGKKFTRLLDNPFLINKDKLHLRMVSDMLQDKNGVIWLASGMLPGGEGICRYDGSSVTGFKPMGDGWIRNVLQSKDGSIYIATRHNGVCRYTEGSGWSIDITTGSINRSSVTAIFEDSKGNIWIATELGSGQLDEDGGVWLYNSKDLKHYTTKDGLIHNGVFAIAEDKAGNIWFGTRNNGLSRFDGTSFSTYSQ